MRNLKIVSREFDTHNDLQNATAMCVNCDTHDVYFADCRNVYTLNIKTKHLSQISLGLNVRETDNRIVAMNYLSDTLCICILFFSGDVVTCNFTTNEIECVGSVESSIHHAAWSPDQEVLALCTGDNKLILMTKDFDTIVEKNLQTTDFGESQPMTVGWGSKATQFHGSEGKGAAKVKTVEAKPALPWDDKFHRISWRRAGDLFVTSVIDSEHGCRKLRIWSREGVLQYTSEMKDGLEHPLCWRPSGNLITCTVQQPNMHTMAFFERNGLQHGSFPLPYLPHSFVVKEVTWNPDSSILAIWGHTLTSSPNYNITLWTVSNNHWYLKQKLDFGDKTIKFVLWDQFQSNTIHVLCTTGTYLQYMWRWASFKGSVSSLGSNVPVAVIDNGCVMVSDFKISCMPPPMCTYSLNFTNAVQTVCFPTNNSNYFLVVLNDDRIAIVSESYKESSEECKFSSFCFKQPKCGALLFSIEWDEKVKKSLHPIFFNHWNWAYNKLLCIGSSDGNTSMLLSVKLGDNNEETVLKGSFLGKLEDVVTEMCCTCDGKVSVLLLRNGKIMKFENGELSSFLTPSGEEVLMPSPSTDFSIHEVNENLYVLGIDDNSKLYCNGRVLFPNCTSYCFHNEFLFITTNDSTLKCCLKSSLSKIVSDGSLSGFVGNTRQIEKGSRIIATGPQDQLILQMPRGNLECISPRPIVISAIGKFLDAIEFGKAFQLAKEHRIHMNILYNHNSEKFLENVEAFVEQIDSPEDLNIFIANLGEEDVTKTLYSFAYPEKIEQNPLKNDERDIICAAIRKVVEKRDIEKYFLTVIASYARKSTPELDQALGIIKGRKASEKLKNASQTTADAALAYLLWLVDVRDLYKVALGTYDLEVAVMVAEKSQMDPMDYLPFLNDLQKLEDSYRKYKIDMHLQRYKLALKNIAKCDDRFKECLALVKNQRLYTSALYLFPSHSENFKIMWSMYGDYLIEKKYYNEAGLVYSKINDNRKALEAYQQSLNWHNAMTEAHILKFTDMEFTVLARNFAKMLKADQRHEEAAILLETYANDVEESIVTLIEGQLWDYALNLMTKYNRLDIVPTHFMPALVDQCNHLKCFLEEIQNTFSSHTERLKIVRKEKSEKSENLIEEYNDDLASDTSSLTDVSVSSKGSSGRMSGSLITRKSSKGRRKQALKKYRLKEGSPNEDLALIVELSALITKVDKLKDNFYSFLTIAVKFDLCEEAGEIQAKMKKLINNIEKEFSNIWIQENKNFMSDMSYGPDCTVNTIAEAIQVHQRIIQQISDPELKPPVWRKNMNMFLNLLDSDR